MYWLYKNLAIPIERIIFCFCSLVGAISVLNAFSNGLIPFYLFFCIYAVHTAYMKKHGVYLLCPELIPHAVIVYRFIQPLFQH